LTLSKWNKKVELQAMDNPQVQQAMRLILNAIDISNELNIISSELYFALNNVSIMLQTYCDPDVNCREFIDKLNMRV